ncbi:coiled-coil domain-containing protein [Pigmentiphaga soli]
MNALTFDTLSMADRLEQAGFSREQARAQTAVLAGFAESNLSSLATREDLERLEQRLRQDLATRENLDQIEHRLRRDLATRADMVRMGEDLQAEMKNLDQALRSDMKNMDQSLRADIKNMSLRLGGEMLLLKWMLGVAVAGIASIVVRVYV